MVQLYKAIKEAKGLVIGSPIYMDYLSAQTKLFLDRLFAFLGPDLRPTLPPGKRAVLVYSQGGGNNPEVMDSLAKFLREALGIEVRGVVGGNGFNELGAVKNRDDLLDKAFSLGQELASE
jgi:multimeric flavodoxin WrbA